MPNEVRTKTYYASKLFGFVVVCFLPFFYGSHEGVSPSSIKQLRFIVFGFVVVCVSFCRFFDGSHEGVSPSSNPDPNPGYVREKKCAEKNARG